MFKSLVKTLLLSGLLFTVLVSLGVKYHWADHYKKVDNKKIALALPQATKKATHSFGTDVVDNNKLEGDFLPEIIRTNHQLITASMTKQQIIKGCEQLFIRMGSFKKDPLFDIVIGDCVVSNYQESFQKVEPKTIKNKALNNRQSQVRNISKEKFCRNKVNNEVQLSDFDKQLLIGICVSGKLSDLK